MNVTYVNIGCKGGARLPVRMPDDSILSLILKSVNCNDHRLFF